ncbi:MAG: toprim domain-containing protein, partial [Desulfobulbaceae bacterium]|nr:toprim domain-containing protein [Desulfobulbaceae bacterium]
PGLKKHDLFNLHYTRGQDTLLVVEGYPDALYLSVAGLDNITAVGQGRLSKSHTEGLKAHGVQSVIISFDNDVPKEDKTGRLTITGVENTSKALDLLIDTDIKPFVLDPRLLDPHKDPDEYVKAEGVSAFKVLVNKAESGAKWKAKYILARHDLHNDLDREKAYNAAILYAGSIPDKKDYHDFINTLQLELNLSDDIISELKKNHTSLVEKEQLSKAYEEIFRKGSDLLSDGKIDEVSNLLHELPLPATEENAVEKIEFYGYQDLLQNVQHTPDGLKTGYNCLDQIIRIPNEAVTIIGGRPSHGKTSVLMNLYLNMIAEYQDKAFLFISYEETRKQIGLKLLNILAGEMISNS